MQTDLPEEKFWKLWKGKIKSPLCILAIIGLSVLNKYTKIIKSSQLVIGICIIMICLVICLTLLKDIIVKCLDRFCQKNETTALYKLGNKYVKYGLGELFIEYLYSKDNKNANDKIEHEKTNIESKRTLTQYSKSMHNDENDECKIYEIKRHTK